MRNGFWVACLFILTSGPARAQTFFLNPQNKCGFINSQNVNSGNAALISDSIAKETTDCTIKTPVLSAKEKLLYMIRSTYEPKSVGFSLAGAGIKQARDSVPEWGQGMEGYGRRLASSFGHKIVKRNIQFAVGSLLHEDPRYFCSGSEGIWRRSFYAASRTFVSNKDGGGIRPGYSKFIATFGGAYISRQWHPERKRKMSEYLTSTAISIGVDMAKNVFNEFWPELQRMMKR